MKRLLTIRMVLAVVLLASLSSCKKNKENAGEGMYYGNYRYIDLGLPSGTLWATFNLGANRPEGFGDYFAWGEITTKSFYNWYTYKYCLGDDETQITKYCFTSWYGYGHDEYGYNGFTDSLTVLQPEDDAATVRWGSDWCMPTREQWYELRDNTTITYTTIRGVNGCLCTGRNGQNIFLPCAGWHIYGNAADVGEEGHYWSSSIDPTHTTSAIGFGILHPQANDPDDFYYVSTSARCQGRSIRAVRTRH